MIVTFQAQIDPINSLPWNPRKIFTPDELERMLKDFTLYVDGLSKFRGYTRGAMYVDNNLYQGVPNAN